MYKVDYKPLSVNECYTGKRFKTSEYKKYKNDMLLILPKNVVIPDGKLEIEFIFGISNDAMDWDNPIKNCQDILASKYGFNDKRIYRGTAEKVIVQKGKEFIKFEIKEYETKSNT